MSIPKFPDFLGVVLQSLADKEAHSVQKGEKSIKDFVIQAFSLTEADLKEMIPFLCNSVKFDSLDYQ